MTVGRTSPRGGNVIILAPTAQAAAAIAPEVVEPPAAEPPTTRPDRWRIVHRVSSIASILGFLLEVARLLMFKRHPAESAQSRCR
jgi:hypothetical protein